MDPRVKKMDEKAEDDAPVDLHLDKLSDALSDWRMVDPSTILHRELLLKMLHIKKIGYEIFDDKDVTQAQKDATLATFNQVLDEWSQLSPLLWKRARAAPTDDPKDLAKEDTEKHLPTEEDNNKPEAIMDNDNKDLPTEEDSMNQLLPQKMEDDTELFLPQEDAKKIQPEKVDKFLPKEVAKNLSQSQMEDASTLFLPQMEEPIDLVLPFVEDLDATLDHDEEVHDTVLQSKEDGANTNLVLACPRRRSLILLRPRRRL